MSDECARERLIGILTRLMCGWRLAPVAVLRSDPQSGLVQRYNRHVASIPRTADVTCSKWFRKHRRLARKRKMPIDSLGQFDATEISHVGLKSLCQRDREIISLCRLPLPSAAVQFIDTSQRYEHTSVPKPGVTPCVTPHGTLFECSDVRESLGAEKLRFQSVFYPPIIERHLEDANLDEQRLLGNLGGNAFEGRSAGCVLVALLTFASELESV